MAPFSSSSLSADAPVFVPQAPLVPLPAPPMFVTYVPHPADMLPPVGLPSQFMGQPPPPGFSSQFQCLPPAPGFPCPVQGQPPPPGFPNPFLGPPLPPMWGFPQGPVAGLPPPGPMPHHEMARPAAPTRVLHAAQPQPAALKNGGDPPAGSGRTWRAASGKCRPKPRPPRMRSAAAKRAVAVGGAGHAVALGDEPSPRSVLTSAATSPPDSPSVLAAVFPYRAVAPSSPPSSKDPGLATWPPRSSRRQTASQTVQLLPTAKKYCGRGSRRRSPRPRRRFDPTSGLTTLMIRNIPNGFTRQKVMNILDQHCAEENEKIALGGGGGAKSEYDFLYVPFDFKSHANKGYCFVNVTSSDAAFRLWKYLHGFRWKANDSRKMCEVDYATIQGRQTLVSHFSNSCFDCDTVDFLPVWFSPPRNGDRPAVVERHVVGRLGRRL